MKSGSVFPYPYYPDCFYPKHWITTLHYEEPKPDTDKTLSSLLRVTVWGLVVSLWWRFDLEFHFSGHGSWLCPSLSHFFNLLLPFMSLKMLGSYLRIVLGFLWFWFLTIRLKFMDLGHECWTLPASLCCAWRMSGKQIKVSLFWW